jgi:hypothetical protein
MVDVVVFDVGTFLEGDADSIVLGRTIRDVSGDKSGAFVAFGLARRLTALARGFVADVPFVLSAMRPAALGVGVAK